LNISWEFNGTYNSSNVTEGGTITLPNGTSGFGELDKNTTGLLFIEWLVDGDEKPKFKYVRENTTDLITLHEESLLSCLEFKKTINLTLDIVDEKSRKKNTGNFTWKVKALYKKGAVL
jgi:hypothetical protein